jgi:hypothetical protein
VEQTAELLLKLSTLSDEDAGKLLLATDYTDKH